MNEQKMREAFEVWYAGMSMPSESDWFKRDGGFPDDYFYATTSESWMAWQAATAATQRDAMAVAEAVRTAMVQSCEAWPGIVEATKRVDLAAIVEAVQPGQQEAVNQWLLAALKRYDIEVEGTQIYRVGSPDGRYVPFDDVAAIAAAEAAQPVVSIASKFFAYDENVGFDLFDTAEEAKKAVQDSIDEYRHEAGEGWPDEVDNVCWGVVLGATKEAPLVDSEGNSTDLAGDRYVDYVLTDCQHTASAQQQGEHEPVGFFNGEFEGDVNGRMKFSVTAYGALPTAGAKLYAAPPAQQQGEPVTFDDADQLARQYSTATQPDEYHFTKAQLACFVQCLFDAADGSMPLHPQKQGETVGFVNGDELMNAEVDQAGFIHLRVVEKQNGWYRTPLYTAPPAPACSVPGEWVDAVQEFVDRCDRGEIRSKRTYEKFKLLLNASPKGKQ